MVVPDSQASDGNTFLGLLIIGVIGGFLWWKLSQRRYGRSTSYWPSPIARDRVFISYSHADKWWMERLKKHLGYLVRVGKIDLWDDTMISPGKRWREEIQAALNRSNIAILLISADYLDSDYIHSEELPRLFLTARGGGCRVISLLVKPSGFKNIPSLADFRAVNEPGRELTGLTEHEQEVMLAKVADIIRAGLPELGR